MSGSNSFGSRFILTSFGESHGAALGAVLDGVPAGIAWDEPLLTRELERRRPGQSSVVSSRGEKDEAEVLSGVYEGKTLGTPIAIIVRNKDARSEDYKQISSNPRPGHADDVWVNKFGHSDPRGGGRSSGRETLSRVIGGAIAQMILRTATLNVRVTGFASQIGPLSLSDADRTAIETSLYANDRYIARFPSASQSAAVEKLLLDAKTNGHSYGGVGEIWIDGVPANLGQPVFHKIKADLASACMSLGATASFELGAGLASVTAEGSVFHGSGGASGSTSSGGAHVNESYGGIRGGITTGERIILRVGFKPTSSVMDVAKKGRHDPCIVPRALPVLEAMAYHVIADHLLWSRTDRVGGF